MRRLQSQPRAQEGAGCLPSRAHGQAEAEAVCGPLSGAVEKGQRLISRKACSACPLEGTVWVKPKERLGWRRLRKPREEHLCRGVREVRLEREGDKLTVETQIQVKGLELKKRG